MGDVLTIALCAVIWLYSVIGMRNGGGPGIAVAIIATVILTCFGFVDLIVGGQLLYAWLLIAAIIAAFAILIFGRDDNLFLN